MSIFTPTLPAMPDRPPERLQLWGINRKAAFAGVTVLMAYLFAGLPVQVGVLAQLDLTAAESSRWFFITWMTTGLFSLGLALFTRQPVSVNLSIPVIIFLAGAAAGFSLPQILGANLVVGLVAIGLSVLRLTEAFTRLVPPPIAVAVFAGSILAFMVKTANLAVTDPAVSGPVFGGYLLALIVTRSHLVGVAAAAASGFAGITLAGGAPEMGGAMAMPAMGLSAIEFNPSAIIALGLPILALTVGVGNIQALALLRSEGYKAKANLYGLAAGAATVLNALGGGHAAAPGGIAVAVASAPAAGPKGSRFWAIVLSSIPVVAVALIAVPVIVAVQDLPLSFTLSVGALALLPTFKVIARKSLGGRMPVPVKAGAITALTVAAMPFQAAGMPMAFWALLAGVLVSVALEHGLIWQTWRPGRAAANSC
ncbi:MAG: benzoate/H(+) symporter BenE family transporter [Chloroflexi bacterium]|nr:benzoate/H(+) symporter BenE family transporter [Chloroflexota bacterium]